MSLLTSLQRAANEQAIHKQSSTLEDPNARAHFEALWAWRDSDPDAEQRSLDALAAESGADAVDLGFVDRLLDDMWSDDDTWIDRLKDSSRQARQRAHLELRPVLTEAEREAVQAHADRVFPRNATFDRPDIGSRVQIVRDRAHTYPGGNTAAFVRDYVRDLPPGWRDSILLDLEAGEHPVICRWTPNREKISATRAWCRQAYQHRDGPRFDALESHCFGGERVVVPAATGPASVTLEQLSSPRSVTATAVVTPTGIEPLDAVLATGGITAGNRVVVQASTAQAKTLILLEWAERRAEHGLVIWLATADELPESIVARRWQRAGLSRVEALAAAAEGRAGLNARLLVVDGREHTIEEVLALRPAPALLVLDPVSKVRTQTDAADPVVRVGNVLDLVEASGWTVLMSAPVVRGAGRRTAAERALGGARIEAGATMLLELVRSGDDLRIGIVKSRLGGEGLEIALRLDRERQRLLPPATPVPGAVSGGGAVRVEERIWADVRGALAERGPLSVRALAERWITGKATAIRAVVRARLEAGELVEVDGKVALP